MPSIAAHMAVAKLVSGNLKIHNYDFIKGNLLPDIILKENSHYKVKGKFFLIPDTDYFKRIFDLYDNLYLGYYVHLLLDKYFLEEFVPKNISNLDVFQDKTMYNDYNLINYQIIKEFGLDVEFLKKVLQDFSVDISKDKLDYNVGCLSIKEVQDTTCLNFNDFSQFLYNISSVISKEIEDYAGSSNKLFVRSR